MAEDFTLTYNGGPYEVLQELIKKRTAWLGEETKNAAVACMIDVTRSLRADTRMAAFRNKSKAIDTGLYAFYDQKRHCWRATSDYLHRSKGAVDIRLSRVELYGVKAKNSHVYKIETERGKVYYVACASAKIALRLEKESARARIKKYKGLAKNALSVAMSKMAVAAPPPGKIGEEVKTKSSQLARVRIMETKDGASVFMTSGVDYGRKALKSGSTDLAMKKAANKVAGMLAQTAKRLPFSVEAPATPFPEVKKRR